MTLVYTCFTVYCITRWTLFSQGKTYV